MSNYLTKEEIRQWRSSLEKITLEEYAARLGKTVEEKKPTNDLADMVMSKGTTASTKDNTSDSFSVIAERVFQRERQLSHTPFSIRKNKVEEKTEQKGDKSNTKVSSKMRDILADNKEDAVKDNNKPLINTAKELSNTSEVNIVLKKSLTDREQLVFEYFLNNVGKTVYAKDLAELLGLPRDYVYKYIKNLRAKIDGDKLKNVQSGGFILTE